MKDIKIGLDRVIQNMIEDGLIDEKEYLNDVIIGSKTNEKIQSAIESYIENVDIIKSMRCEADEIARLQDKENKEFADRMELLAKEDPVVYPFEVFGYQEIFPIIERCAQNRGSLPQIPISCLRDEINGINIYTPHYVNWQINENRQKNFVFTFNSDEDKRKAVDAINQMVLSIMLAFPIKKTHISILDLEMADDMNLLTQKLDMKLFDVIISDQEVSKLAEYLKREYFFSRSRTIESTCELVIIPTPPGSRLFEAQKQLLPFFINGSRYGIYFFVMNDLSKPVHRVENEDYFLDHKDVCQLIDVNTIKNYPDQQDGLTKTISFACNEIWSSDIIKYINDKTKE